VIAACRRKDLRGHIKVDGVFVLDDTLRSHTGAEKGDAQLDGENYLRLMTPRLMTLTQLSVLAHADPRTAVLFARVGHKGR